LKILLNRVKFSKTDYGDPIIPDGFNSKIWVPSLSNFIPPGKGKKYFIFWIFHYLHIFRNRDYCAFFIYKNDINIASLLVVPAYFKWPFMEKNDVQITYVMTRPEYRGKGFGKIMLHAIMQQFKMDNRNFWYVTDTDNPASIKLSAKVGFEFWAYGKTEGFLRILKPEQKFFQ
jgi:RimJ/RimL family protein N-acetyltransferase